MSHGSKRTSDLSPEEKRTLLAQLLQKKASSSTSTLPLSSNQQALWFLHKLAPQSWAYNVLFTAQINSNVDIPALQRAFQALVDRHPSLRTTYAAPDSKPVQQVHKHWQVHFEETDASTWSQNSLNNRLVEEARRPFDLERGPLLRVNLFTVAPTKHILLLSVHHIAVDFWSLTVLLDELRVLYPAQTGTQALPPLDLQYADYVRWQTNMLASAEGERLWSYWQRQLAGELPQLNLPTDRPRPPVQTYCGASYTFKLSEELTRQIKALAKAEEATLYMTILAAFQVLLHRYTGQEDILVGSPTTGRTRREFSGIVGDFINSVVLRANLSGNLTFKTFLSQVRYTVLDALKHQDYPFSLLVERLHPAQDPSRSPLFQVMLILRKLHRFEELSELMVLDQTGTRIDFGGLSAEAFPLAQQEGQFDLTLEMLEIGGVLFGVLKYNPDLFDAVTIALMAGHFQTLLSGVVANPNDPISTLPLLSAAERYQLLVEWNDTQVDYPKDVCIHQLFEAQAKRTPDEIAVVFANEHLTYRELNARSSQVAHYLRSLGVGPDVLVGICLERSLLMVVGLLGILKAGGAYVPLDPAYPKERLAFMLEDAQVPLLLTQNSLLERIPECGARLVCLDSDWHIVLESQENPISETSELSKTAAEHLAYVIYTSGSTGKPKGVQIPHRALVNFLHSMQKQPGLTNGDVLLAVTSLSFDIAALEIFLPLIVGARLVVVSREVATDGAQLLACMVNGATALQATPATWRLLLQSAERLSGGFLRSELSKRGWQGSSGLKVLCGGESLSREMANQLLQGATLWNLYGPTETTIWSTVAKVESSGGLVPIGRPIANTQIYLLDKHLQPVPVGVAGEMYIGGAGLARGYFNRPDLTAQKFIPNPFSEEPGSRLYKTGDLARYLSDGNIEFLGRIDHQVKLRGFRIELGEIEVALSQHPGVRETVVLPREDVPGDKRLVAYVVPYQSPGSTPSELRHFLKDQLPEYMVPSAFVTLETLPLTPNGKVDRRMLPAPESFHHDLEASHVPPGTEMERAIALIWQEVLHINNVGVHDNFFALGGHSLLVAQIHSRLQEVLDRNVSMIQLFKYPTINGLARYLTQEQDLEVQLEPQPSLTLPGDYPSINSDRSVPVSIESLVPLQSGGNKPPLFCIYGILLYSELARNLGAEQPVYGVYIQEEVDLLKAGKLENQQTALTSVAELATRYLKEIRTLQPVGPYFLAGESFGGLVAFEMAQQLHLQGEKVALLALFDTEAPGGLKKLSLPERLSIHLKNVTKEGPTYALEKIRHRRVVTSDVRQQVRNQAVSNYVPHPYHDKVILFRAMHQSKFEAYSEPELGWGSLAAGGLEVHNVPGDHIGILKQPHVSVLAEKLKVCLEQAHHLHQH